MDNLEIAQMTYDDIGEVVVIENESFSVPWSYKSFEDSLNLKYGRFFVAKLDKKIVGYIGLYLVGDDGDITNVAVSSDYRRKGIAGKLIEEVIMCAKENQLSFINLEVRPSNAYAINLYTKYGFEKLGIRKNFYTKPTEDALIMQKEILK